MKAKTVGKCIYCNDPIYEFQATIHEGCARQAGIREVVEWIESEIILVTSYAIFTRDNPDNLKDWRAKLKEWGIENG